MTWQRAAEIFRLANWVPVAIVFLASNALAEEKVPIGPELAPREIGVLLKAYPTLFQTNPLAPGGVGAILWSCEYRVGRAMITITHATEPGGPMPCKREVAFGEPHRKAP